jgi:S-formylglutathione hydrolase FrmB
MWRQRTTYAMILALFIACGLTASAGWQDLVFIRFESDALKANQLGNGTSRRVFAYLPPSYHEEPSRRYPVLYWLHGAVFTGTWVSGIDQGMFIQDTMPELIAGGSVSEMIVVMPDTSGGRYSDMFYTDSPLTGDFETFLSKELIEYIDSNYRTLAQPESRGIGGHSLGGYGSIRMVMRHPDVFGAAYLHDAGGLSFEAWGVFNTDSFVRTAVGMQETGDYSGLAGLDVLAGLLLAAGSSFTPNVDRLPSQVDLPWKVVDGSVRRVEAVWERWLEFDPFTQLPKHVTALQGLRGLAIDTGLQVEKGTTLVSSRAFHEALVDAGVAHRYEEYDGDHGNMNRELAETRILPFFSEVLAAED